jgi:hypothetical protein
MIQEVRSHTKIIQEIKDFMYSKVEPNISFETSMKIGSHLNLVTRSIKNKTLRREIIWKIQDLQKKY